MQRIRLVTLIFKVESFPCYLYLDVHRVYENIPCKRFSLVLVSDSLEFQRYGHTQIIC